MYAIKMMWLRNNFIIKMDLRNEKETKRLFKEVPFYMQLTRKLPFCNELSIVKNQKHLKDMQKFIELK